MKWPVLGSLLVVAHGLYAERADSFCELLAKVFLPNCVSLKSNQQAEAVVSNSEKTSMVVRETAAGDSIDIQRGNVRIAGQVAVGGDVQFDQHACVNTLEVFGSSKNTFSTLDTKHDGSERPAVCVHQGACSFATGSAAAPSITFADDATTGIYSPEAQSIAMSTHGVRRFFIDAQGNTILSNAYRLHAFLSRPQVIENKTSDYISAPILYDAISFDDHHDFDVARGEYVAPVTGIYSVKASVSVTANLANSQIVLRIVRNKVPLPGYAARATCTSSNSNRYFQVVLDSLVLLQEKDRIYIDCMANTHVTLQPEYTQVSVFFIAQ